MTAGNAILIVAIVTGLGLIGALFFVMFKIRQISREFFGTSSLIEGLKRQEALEDDTPKSVSGMTRVELPRIEKDFPEFHWPEWKQRCENQLKGYLEALEHRDLSYLGKVSVSLKDQVRLKIEEMEENTGMIAVLWNVDPLDWNTDNETEIVNKVVTETEENDIILLHDCYLSSVKAALRIINIMQAKGYEFVTVDELLLD